MSQEENKRLESIEAKIDILTRYIVGDPDTTGINTRLDRVEQKMSLVQWLCGGFGLASIAAIVETAFSVFRGKS